MKTLFAIALSLLMSAYSVAQKTTVSAKVTGTNGVPYVNCQFNVDFVPNPSLPAGTTYTYGGNPAFQTSYVGNKCDGFGNFQIQLPDNNVISPSTPYQSQWRFQFVSANGYLGGPYGCFVTVTITGSTQDISNNIEPICPPLPQGGAGTVSGTPPHVAKFTSTTTVGDSSGLDPGNTPTQWPLGLNVIGNAGYLQDTVGTAGVVANELVDFDSSGNIVVSAAGTNKPKGIADVGALVGGSVPRAVWGRHACVFDNQTTANDFVAPSATNGGQCSDVGPTKVNNATIIGTVVTVNTGAGTLANVDLLPWDTLAPGSSGGSGTVSACATANSNALFAIAGTVVSCDPLVTDDGNGNMTMKSAGFTDTTHAGFWFETAGPTPPAAPPNSTQFYVGTSISTPNSFQLPVAAGAADVGKAWGVSSSTTDTNGNPVDIMGLITAGGGGGSSIRTCLVTIGDPGATSPALANDNDSPAQCGNDIGSDLSIAGVACWADAGSPVVNPILTGGSSTSILSSPLTCGTGSWAAGTVNGTPALHTFSGAFATCASTPCTLDANISTAGGTAKYIVMKFTASGAGGGGGGGSGTVTSVAASVPAWLSISGSPVTTAGTLAFGATVAGSDYLLTSTAANTAAWEQVNTGSSCGDSSHAVSYDASTHKFGCQAISAGTGTVTSVALNLPSIFTVSGSPVTTTGTLTGTLNPPGADYLPTATALNTVAWKQVNGGASCGDSSHALSYDAVSHLVGCQTLTTGGSGTVTSVAQTVPTGFNVAGSPITGAGTLAITTSGLTTNKLQKAVSGGIGDSSITDNGTAISTSETMTVGNLIDSGLTASSPVCSDGSKQLSSACAGVSGVGLTAFYPNHSSTGTTNFVPAKFFSYGINQKDVVKTDSTDNGIGWFTNIVGIVQSGGGTTGSAAICYAGRCTCQFDNAATAGDFVQIGSTGLCSADSAAGVNENPEVHKYFAKVHTTISGAGNTDVDMLPVGAYSHFVCCGTNETAARYQTSTPGSPFLTNGNLFIDGSSPGVSNNPMVGTTAGYVAYSTGNVNKGAKLTGEYATTLNDGVTSFYGMALRLDTDTGMAPQFGYSIMGACINGASCVNADGSTGNSASMFTAPDVDGAFAGAKSFSDSIADSHIWTLTGNLTSITLSNVYPGHVTRWTIKQDGTGGRTFAWPSIYINAPTVSALPNDTTTADFWAADATHVYCVAGCTGPIRWVNTGKTAAISTTTLANTKADSTYRVTASINCDSSSAAATVNVTIGWTDPSNTAQTATLGSAVVCTTLGSASIGSLTTTFRAKSGTAITGATSIVNSPTYDAVVTVETLTAN